MKQLLSKLFLRLLRLGCDCVTHAKDIIYMAQGKHRLVYAERAGKLPEAASYARVAVVALYPNQYSVPFTINLMKALAENGFFILGVSGKKLPASISTPLLDHCHVLTERFRMGRDFATYKAGIEWVSGRASLKDMEVLALVNDSLFYPASTGRTINDILARSGDWTALFENFAGKYHAQSFFCIFRKPVFASAAFHTFWKEYIPFSSRTYSIEQGEIKLSRMLLKAGFTPSALYSSIAIGNALASASERADTASENIWRAANRILTKNMGAAAAARLYSLDDKIVPVTVPYGERLKDSAPQIAGLAEILNPTHTVGLMCNLLFHAPFKRDICARTQLSLYEVISFARGFSPEEKEFIMADIRVRGLPASFPYYTWRGLKRSAGVE